MRRTGIVAVALALLALLVAVPGAFAGPPGKWTRITGIEGVPAANTDEVGLLRTADGVLHVAWTRPAGGLGDTVLHSAISADAKSVSGPDPILTAANNGINSSVDLVGAPGGGLRVLFAGLFPETPLDTVMASATAPEAGMPWSAPSPVSSIAPATRSPVYVAAGIGGAVSPSGETVLVWGDSGPEDGGYHLGLDPTTPDVPFPVGLAVDPNATFDAAGTAYLAWIVLGGLETPGSLQVMPVGGAPVTVPKSAAAWTGQRVSISSRIGAGGVYVAYGSGSNEFDALPAWWRVGAAKPIVIKGQRDAEHTGLAPAPGGRLWIYWNRHGRLYAARTDQKAKKLGAIVSVKPPKGTDAIYNLQAEGSRGPLDVLALADAKGGLGYFQQRILPGLSLAAKPKAVKAGKKLTLRATDAGTPVKGAKLVLALGKKKLKKKTNAKGKASFKIPAKTKPGKYTATATRGGYAKARTKLRVKP